MASWQMVSCSKCKRCLAGSPAHGPYLFFHERLGKKEREHKYGGKGSSGGATSTTISLKGQGPPNGYAGATLDRVREEERERIRAEADKEYELRERALTPRQREQRGVVLGLVGRLRNVQRRQRRETDKRVREAERDVASRSSSGSAPPGLLARAAAQIRSEVAEQFALEVAQIKKDIALQRKELAKMLKA